MSTRYPKDPGLSARMAVTIFLLGLLYVVFIGPLLAVGVSYGLVIIIAGGLLFAQYFFSDKIALFSMHARVVSEQEAPELHAIVDRLCALADMPKPRVGIAQSDVPNAFATVRSPRAAVVCVTSGIMRRLDHQELEAVLTHDLSPAAHPRVAAMTIATSPGGGAGGALTVFFFRPPVAAGLGLSSPACAAPAAREAPAAARPPRRADAAPGVNLGGGVTKFFDAILGRSKPVPARLDALF